MPHLPQMLLGMCVSYKQGILLQNPSITVTLRKLTRVHSYKLILTPYSSSANSPRKIQLEVQCCVQKAGDSLHSPKIQSSTTQVCLQFPPAHMCDSIPNREKLGFHDLYCFYLI